MKENGKKIEKKYNQINQSKTDFVKTVSASGDHLPKQPITSAFGDHLPMVTIPYGTLEEAEAAIENLSKKSPHKFFIHRALSNEEKERQKKEVCGEEENGVTSFVMPQGQNDFHNANVDQTVQIDKNIQIVQ